MASATCPFQFCEALGCELVSRRRCSVKLVSEVTISASAAPTGLRRARAASHQEPPVNDTVPFMCRWLATFTGYQPFRWRKTQWWQCQRCMVTDAHMETRAQGWRQKDWWVQLTKVNVNRREQWACLHPPLPLSYPFPLCFPALLCWRCPFSHSAPQGGQWKNLRKPLCSGLTQCAEK